MTLNDSNLREELRQLWQYIFACNDEIDLIQSRRDEALKLVPQLERIIETYLKIQSIEPLKYTEAIEAAVEEVKDGELKFLPKKPAPNSTYSKYVKLEYRNRAIEDLILTILSSDPKTHFNTNAIARKLQREDLTPEEERKFKNLLYSALNYGVKKKLWKKVSGVGVYSLNQ